MGEKKKMSAMDIAARTRHSIAHAMTQNETNFWETYIHLVKGNIGVGLFAMGDAFKNGGIVVSPIIALGMAFICIHCQHLLLDAAKAASLLHYGEIRRLDYGQALELCFAEGPQSLSCVSAVMGTMCNYIIAITQIGLCCVYLTFIGTNVREILLTNNIDIDIHYVVVIIWIPIWACCLITQLKTLAPISFVSNIIILSSFFITMYVALKDGLPSFKERKPYTSFNPTMLCFSTVIFSYEGIALLLPIKNAMKYPPDFDKKFGVLNLGMALVVTLYMMGGVIGYMKWGEKVGGTMSSNLGQNILAQCTKGFVALAILLTYPLQFFVPISAMLPTILNKLNCLKSNLLCELIFRTLLAILTLAIAVAFPNVEIFISLIGGLCSTLLAVVFPPLMECLLLKKSVSNSWIIYLKAIKNSLILILAVFTFFVGTYVSLIEIIKYFKGLKKSI